MNDFVSESIQCSVQADDSSLKCLSNVKAMIVLQRKMTRALLQKFADDSHFEDKSHYSRQRIRFFFNTGLILKQHISLSSDDWFESL